MSLKTLKGLVSAFNKGVQLEEMLEVYLEKPYIEGDSIIRVSVRNYQTKRTILVSYTEKRGSLDARTIRDYLAEMILNQVVREGFKAITNVEETSCITS